MSSVLKNTFYTVSGLSSTDNSVKALISINPAHDVFKGHFPQMPVVPGVCQLQIIKDILEEVSGTSLMMTNGDNIKFTGMILPDKNPTVNLEMTYTKNETGFVVDAKLFFEETVFTKHKGKYKILN